MTTFYSLGLIDSTLKAIEEAGFTTPTPIQAQAIPSILQGRDVLACAQTGTGKTASFTLPMMDILDSGEARARMPRSLIIEPTRELATQVAENFKTFGKYHKLSMALLIGGESFVDQQKLLQKGVDVLIATPGRLLDLFERGQILLTGVQIFVIDEADRMLDMGFIPDIEKLASLLPPRRQNILLSATMPPAIKKLAAQFLNNPKEITITPEVRTAATIEQYYIKCLAKDKRDTLRQLIRQEGIPSAIVFCNRKRDIDILQKSMDQHGFKSGTLHGDLSQPERNRTLQSFKDKEINFLLASDVAARGIDIEALPYVINFDVPLQPEDYVHRIGRTGRAGKTGHAYMLVSPMEDKGLKAIVKMNNSTMTEYVMKEKSSASRKPDPKKSETVQNLVPAGDTQTAMATAVTESQTQTPVTVPAQSQSKPAPKRHENKPRSERAPRHGKADKRNSNQNDLDNDNVVGFGDEIPSFMQFKA